MNNSKLLTLLAILIIPIMLTSCPPTPKPTPVDDVTAPGVDGTGDDAVTTDGIGAADTAHTDAEIAEAKAKLNKILGDLYFDYNRSTLRPLSKSVLKGAALVLKDFKSINIKVEGHCDNRGTVEYNLALGERRAYAVKRYLKNLDVSSRQISTISYGEDKPQCDDDNEVCWQKNRRAHFSVR